MGRSKLERLAKGDFFTWKRCVDGYYLDGDTIRAKSENFEEIAPCAISPPVHYIFSQLHLQVMPGHGGVIPGSRIQKRGTNAGKPRFWEMAFESRDEAALAFTNQYGFLYDAKDMGQRLEYFWEDQKKISGLLGDRTPTRKEDCMLSEVDQKLEQLHKNRKELLEQMSEQKERTMRVARAFARNDADISSLTVELKNTQNQINQMDEVDNLIGILSMVRQEAIEQNAYKQPKAILR